MDAEEGSKGQEAMDSKFCMHSFEDLPKGRMLATVQDVHGLWFCIRQCSTSTSSDKASQESTAATKVVAEEHTSSDYEESIKQKILAASLPFVNEHGWTKHAISAGAETVGYPGVAHGLFPKGGIELVQYFYVTCNQELASALEKQCEETAADTTKRKNPTVLIQSAVAQRLHMITPYVSKWPQALAMMSLPPNVPAALANLLTLVDDICYYAGDRSVDFNWYTRRVALAGLYKTTELYLVQDKSEDFKETWQFLERRIDDISQLHNYMQQSGEVTQVAKEAVTAAFITARNILGLNLGNR